MSFSMIAHTKMKAMRALYYTYFRADSSIALLWPVNVCTNINFDIYVSYIYMYIYIYIYIHIDKRFAVGHYPTLCSSLLTHLGLETHIRVSEISINGPDNGLSPGRRHAIILTNTGILLIGSLETTWTSVKFQAKFKHFHSRKWVWMRRLQNSANFASASICW